MTIFRENTEDIYAGIEWAEGTDEVEKVIQFLSDMGMRKKFDSLKLLQSVLNLFLLMVVND